MSSYSLLPSQSALVHSFQDCTFCIADSLYSNQVMWLGRLFANHRLHCTRCKQVEHSHQIYCTYYHAGCIVHLHTSFNSFFLPCKGWFETSSISTEVLHSQVWSIWRHHCLVVLDPGHCITVSSCAYIATPGTIFIQLIPRTYGAAFINMTIDNNIIDYGYMIHVTIETVSSSLVLETMGDATSFVMCLQGWVEHTYRFDQILLVLFTTSPFSKSDQTYVRSYALELVYTTHLLSLIL